MIALLRYFLDEAAPGRRAQFLWLMGLIVLCGVVELASLGLLALFITSLTSPEAVMRSRAVLLAQHFLPINILGDARTFHLALGGGTIASVLLKNGLACLQTYATARFDGAINVDYGCLMLRGFLELPYSWSSRKNSSDLLSLLGWRLYVGNLFAHSMTLFSETLISVMLLATLLVLQPLSTLLVIAVLAGIGLASFLLVRSRIATVGLKISRLHLLVNKICMQSLQGLKDVKLFNRTEPSVDHFEEAQSAFVRQLAQMRVLERTTVWVLESVGLGGLVVGALVMVLSSRVSTADMMGALSLLAVSAWRILPAMYRGVATISAIQGYAPFLEQINEVVQRIRAHEREQVGLHPVSLPPLERDIRFDAVTYTYPGGNAPALQHIDLTIPRGGFVGLIGHSGAGKSTLVDVLTGLVLPDSGRVLIDGRPLGPDSIASWRNQFGFVPQSPYLFDGSLAQNVAFTIDERCIDRARVSECCVQAGLDDILDGLPAGLDTVIGERGGQLSGGQAQRVAIARALYHDPRVLIFDEATSSLDNATEQRIRKTIATLRGRRTVVLIAHRLDTVRDCDRIVRLEQGRIVDQGPSEAILARYDRDAREQ
ncbi:MAG: ABC transporter ATP-binding protein [Desulfovibrionaceae bacterium]